jgi:D-alanine-D-alanine ligase
VRRRRVLVLVHADFVPPEDVESLTLEESERMRTELDVIEALGRLGHDVQTLGVRDELVPIRQTVTGWRPHVVFNLLEEFQEEAVFDQNVVSYLEVLGVPHTGCGPRGLILARDKALAKKIAVYHRIPTPRFGVCARGRRPRVPRGADYPLIVKSLLEEASLGISQASVVRSDAELAERVAFVHERIETDALIEQFIPGRELYVGVLGNQRLEVLPPLELVIDDLPADADLVATARVKHDLAYQEKRGVRIRPAPKLGEALHARLERAARRLFRALDQAGYARIDFRLAGDGVPYFLEANPNPEIAREEEMATAAAKAGYAYEALIQKLVALGLRRGTRRPRRW